MATPNTIGRCPGMPVPDIATTSVMMAAMRWAARIPSMRVPRRAPCRW